MVNFSVEVYDDEHFERALRRFSVKTKKTGLMRDLKRKRFYTKPSVQRKIDRQKSIRRQKKAERLAELAAGGKDVRKGRGRGAKDREDQRSGPPRFGSNTGGFGSGGFGGASRPPLNA